MIHKEFEDYRRAGELFGRLETELCFGSLSMHVECQFFVFQWRFEAKGNPYGQQLAVAGADLMTESDLNRLAETTATAWRDSVRNAQLANSGSQDR